MIYLVKERLATHSLHFTQQRLKCTNMLTSTKLNLTSFTNKPERNIKKSMLYLAPDSASNNTLQDHLVSNVIRNCSNIISKSQQHILNMNLKKIEWSEIFPSEEQKITNICRKLMKVRKQLLKKKL